MVCPACSKQSADEFRFCPHCGKNFWVGLPMIESPPLSPEIRPVKDTPGEESGPSKDGVSGNAIKVGSLIFGAFSAVSLLVSIFKGLVPIYLLEAAGWAGVAWHWQGRKTHSGPSQKLTLQPDIPLWPQRATLFPRRASGSSSIISRASGQGRQTRKSDIYVITYSLLALSSMPSNTGSHLNLPRMWPR